MRVPNDLFGRAHADDLTAMDARARADIENIVGFHHRLLVVLHDQQRVSEIPQVFQRGEQLCVVPLVQADAGLVQNIEHAHQTRANLRCQPDALCLAAGKRPGRTGEGEVPEPHIHQEVQPGVQLLEHPVGHSLLLLIQHQVV